MDAVWFQEEYRKMGNGDYESMSQRLLSVQIS